MKNLLKLSACLACLIPAAAIAQDPANYPVKALRIVVPFGPGGGTDGIARVIAQSLSKRLGQPVIVDNRPGAGGSLGAGLVATAKADGYTLLLGSNGPIAINPSLYRKLSYSPSRDFVPVANIASMPFLIVANCELPANNIPELLALAKAKPGAITYASPGNGTTNHLAGAMLESMGHVDMLHVPYKGASAAANDVIGGQVNIMSGDINTLLPMVRSGKLKALAVTGAKRSAVLPDVPTVAENGLPAFEAIGWFGLFAPRATPPAITARLNREVNEVLKEENVKLRVHALGGVINGGTPETFQHTINDESKKWAKVIADQKIPVEG